MREKIEELAQGNFLYGTPWIELSVPLVELRLNADEEYVGSFTVKSLNTVLMKGIVYTSDSRMVCDNPRFTGLEAEIRFLFRGRGSCEGDTAKGNFYIISNGGEFSLPFCVYIQKSPLVASIGEIKNLFHFANLAASNWEEAFRLFRTPGFTSVFKNHDRRYEQLYTSLTGGQVTRQCLEEFLIGIHKKAPIEITIPETKKEFTGMTADLKEQITLTKSSWGHVRVSVSADAPFIGLYTKEITTGDFIGSTYQLSYVVHKDKLHKGKNFARIKIETVRQELIYEVTAEAACEAAETQASDRVSRKLVKQARMELVRLYIAYRLRKIHTNPWAKECMEQVEKLLQTDENSRLYRLMKAHILFIEKKSYEAHSILESFAAGKKELHSDSLLYAYYLYLTTYWKKEKKYGDKTADEVKKLYNKNRDRWEFLWILLSLDGKFTESPIKRLGMIEEQCIKGCKSPVMYAEAYCIMKDDPIVLTRLGFFEQQVLHWAAGNGELTRDIMLQTAILAGRINTLDPVLWHILTKGYEAFPEREILSAICSILIKNARTEPAYFKWYSLGVEQDLRITRLYEYYMYAIPADYEGTIPRAVLMYFIYYNNLDYRKTAFLYEHVILQRDMAPELFQGYRRYIEKFVLEQLMQKHINEKLAFIYETMLALHDLTPELAEAVSGVIFTCRLYCTNSKMKNVIVTHRHLKEESVYPLSRGRAYIRLYTKDYAIALEDGEGSRYALSIGYELKRMMDEAFYLKKCFELNVDSPEVKVCMCEQFISTNSLSDERMEYLLELTGSDNIREEYKKELKKAGIRYCLDQYTDSVMGYIERIGTGSLEGLQRSKVIEYMISKGYYEEAYEAICRYGWNGVGIKKLVRLASRNMVFREMEEDPVLLSLGFYVFEHKKYDEVVLKYLVLYYNGSLKWMKAIWEAACRFEADASELAERILVQALFAEAVDMDTDEIFAYYDKAGARFQIARAYLAYESRAFLVDDKPVSDLVFSCLAKEQQEGSLLNDTCRLALLKHYSLKEELSDEELLYAEKELKEFINRNMYFGFYQNFQSAVLSAFCSEGRKYIEYKADPGRKLYIHFIQDEAAQDPGDYVIEEMKQVFPGIFSKQFTMFYGETVQYFITGEGEPETLLESGILTVNEMDMEGTESRYTMLNDMSVCMNMHDSQTLLELMEKYAWNSYMVEKLFTCR